MRSLPRRLRRERLRRERVPHIARGPGGGASGCVGLPSPAALAVGADKSIDENRRAFFYMPFEHAEDMDEQERCVALFEALGNENYLDYAHQHLDVIKRFGRFPHRNPILGRTSTPEEKAYLAEPGAGF